MESDEDPSEDDIHKRLRAAYEVHSKTFVELPGAAALVEIYGHVPSFHDAEVRELRLSAKSTSIIKVRNLFPDIFSRGQVIVTLTLEEVVDVDLDGFSPQNVLQCLYVRPAASNPKREMYYPRGKGIDYLEIDLDPIYGIGGTIICRGISVSWTKDRIARGLSKAPPPPSLLGQ